MLRRRTRPLIPSTCILLALLLVAASSARAQTGDSAAADAAVHALCNQQVALLGESPTHSFGAALDVKVHLVRRLINECHYNALFMEAGLYDYLHLQQEQRAGHAIPDAAISAAIGGLWANQEVQSLVPFLGDRVRAGSLTLGGLDDQLGAGTWASAAMPISLVQSLPPGEQSRCRAILDRHMQWQYTDAAPYGPADKAKILTCLNEIQTTLPATAPNAAETRAMIASLNRMFARNFTEDDFTQKAQEVAWFNDRDHSMYLNYEWLAARLPPHSKIILWAATVHTANDLHAVPGFEGRISFGSYIKHERGAHAYSLGFSAYSGDYMFRRQPLHHLSDAPPTSLESQTFTHTTADTAFLSNKQLSTLGPLSARVLGTAFVAAPWNEVVDGLITIRTERPPRWILPPQ